MTPRLQRRGTRRWSNRLDLYEDALRRAAIEQHNIGGIIFGLKNLRAAKWRDRHEIDRRSLNANVNLHVPLPASAERHILELLRARLEAGRLLLPAPPEEQ